MKSEVEVVETSDMLKEITAVRSRTVAICSPLRVEDYVPQPVEFVSPPKWHLAHTTWFFETFLLVPHLPQYRLYNEDFSFLFNSYYNAVGKRVLRADRGNITRPDVAEIYQYRSYVDKHLLELIEKCDNKEEINRLLVLGMHHEQQHQELLLTDLKYILGHNPIFPVYAADSNLVDQKKRKSVFHKVEEGVYSIGFEGEGFHFDNELGRHKCYLHSFEIADDLVTNGAYLDFVKDGAYRRSDLWLDEGWSWINQNEVSKPLYWHEIEGSWHQFTLSGLRKLMADDILCHINYYEASAFAEWAGYRLPTEREWEVAQKHFGWGHRWEWTNSAYLPYPGFTTAPGALGEYNGKFMINQMVLRGASVATAGGHSRPTYRNFFHPHLSWQFTGIRLAKK